MTSFNVGSLKYPLTLAGGNLALSYDTDAIRDQIFSVLETRPGERIMQPGFGLPDLVFHSVADVGVVAGLVEQELQAQIAGVTFQVSGSLTEDGLYLLAVQWSIDQEQFQQQILVEF